MPFPASAPSQWNADIYREVNELAHKSPPLLRYIAEVGTEAGLLLFALVFVVGWWYARRENSSRMALALLAPVVTIGAYLSSEVAKSLFREARPCDVMSQVRTIAECPPPGDWSLPSNHATIVSSCAAAIIATRPRMALLVLPLAGIMGFSRVFVGVHYPFDVLLGFAVGTMVSLFLLSVLQPSMSKLVEHFRKYNLLRPLVAANPKSKRKAHRLIRRS